MTDPANDQALWGVVVLAVSFVVLVLGVLYAVTWRPEVDVPLVPFDAEEVYTYTCYCYREPIHIRIRASELPRRHAYGRLAMRHARPAHAARSSPGVRAHTQAVHDESEQVP